MKSLDLKKEHFERRLAPPPVLKPRTTTAPGLKGSMPLKPGEIILTEREKVKLRQMGWKDGDPLPGDFGKFVSMAQQEVSDELRAAKPPQHLKSKIPATIDISQLDSTRQAELSRYLQQFKEMAPNLEAAATANSRFEELTPAAQKAMKDAGAGIEVVDSRDPVQGMQRLVDEAEGRLPADKTAENSDLDEDDEPTAPASSPTGAVGPPLICQRCGHQHSNPVKEPDQGDVMAYAMAILGGQSFRKSYDLLGGKVSVVFKQPDTNLADMALTQVAREKRHELLGEGESLRKLMIYRMLMSLESVTVGNESYQLGQDITAFMSEPCKNGDQNSIAELERRIISQPPFQNESIWRMCRMVYERFDELLGILDTRAEEPGFWSAIEG